MARWTLIVAIAAGLLSACAATVDTSRPGGGGSSGAYVGVDGGR
jgi:hypothetical protein